MKSSAEAHADAIEKLAATEASISNRYGIDKVNIVEDYASSLTVEATEDTLVELARRRATGDTP